MGPQRPAAEQDAGAVEVPAVFLAVAGGVVGVYADRAWEDHVKQPVGFADSDLYSNAGKTVGSNDRVMGCYRCGDV